MSAPARPVRIQKVLFRQVRRPMKTLFATALGQKKAAVSVLVTVVLEDGSQGTGEVPTSFVLPHETPEAIKAILREARAFFAGVPYDDCGGRFDAFRARHARFHMTLAGLEVAIFRAALACRGIGEHAYWGQSLRRLETDITISFQPDRDVLADWLGRITRAFDRAKSLGGRPGPGAIVGKFHFPGRSASGFPAR